MSRAKGDTHVGAARPTVERLAEIARRLRDMERVNCTLLARRFEVTRKTCLRDLHFLRDRMGYEFRWNAQLSTYELITAPRAIL